jgi:hypothetical protein
MLLIESQVTFDFMASSLFGISTYCKSELPKRDNYAIFVDLWFSGLKKVARRNKSKILDLTPPSPCTFRTRTCKRVVNQKEGEYLAWKFQLSAVSAGPTLWFLSTLRETLPQWHFRYTFYMCIEKICNDKDIYFYSQWKGKIAWRIACADLAIQVYAHMYSTMYISDFAVMLFFSLWFLRFGKWEKSASRSLTAVLVLIQRIWKHHTVSAKKAWQH